MRALGRDFIIIFLDLYYNIRIVDARFRDSDYRPSQNYVGETVAWQKERIHFACPKPGDLADLMDGLMAAHERMNTGGVSAVIQAAGNSVPWFMISRYPA